jgi:hypothetical protein
MGGKVLPRVAIVAIALRAAGVGDAEAQPVSGFYVQGSAGVALQQQPPIAPSSAMPSTSAPSAAAAANAAINGSPGAAESGSAGWGLANGTRLEIEGIHTTQNVGP